jgi:hypothetical protein
MMETVVSIGLSRSFLMEREEEGSRGRRGDPLRRGPNCNVRLKIERAVVKELLPDENLKQRDVISERII